MERLPLIILAMLVVGCTSAKTASEPSLALRATEAIDPRVPIPDKVPTGTADAALATGLDALVGQARNGVPLFDAREAVASRLGAAAGPMASESWVAAQQALSLLIEQYGVTTRAAADIDALAAARLNTQHWIRPADQAAIATAASDVAAISARQASAIDRLKDQLAR